MIIDYITEWLKHPSLIQIPMYCICDGINMQRAVCAWIKLISIQSLEANNPLRPYLIYKKLTSIMYSCIKDGKINTSQFLMMLRSFINEDPDRGLMMKDEKSWWFLKTPESLKNKFIISQVVPDPWKSLARYR